MDPNDLRIEVFRTVRGRVYLDPTVSGFVTKHVIGEFEVYVAVALSEGGTLSSRVASYPIQPRVVAKVVNVLPAKERELPEVNPRIDPRLLPA